jgi:hypothetical protein
VPAPRPAAGIRSRLSVTQRTLLRDEAEAAITALEDYFDV